MSREGVSKASRSYHRSSTMAEVWEQAARSNIIGGRSQRPTSPSCVIMYVACSSPRNESGSITAYEAGFEVEHTVLCEWTRFLARGVGMCLSIFVDPELVGLD